MSGFPPVDGGGDLSQSQKDAIDSIIDLPDNAVPKVSGGKLVASGTNVDPVSEEWDFDESINLPPGSVNIGTNISISDFGEFLASKNNATGIIQLVVTSDAIQDEGILLPNITTSQPIETLALQPSGDDFGPEQTEGTPREFILDPSGFSSSVPSEEFLIIENIEELAQIPASGQLRNQIWIGTDDTGHKIFDFIFDLTLGVYSFKPPNPQVFRSGQLYFVRTSVIGPGNLQFKGLQNGPNFFPKSDIRGYAVQSNQAVTRKTAGTSSDNYLRLNDEYETASGVTGGIVQNFLPTVTADTVTAGQFTPGIVATSNPTVVTDGSATFAQNDIVLIKDSNFNNGYFEVENHVSTLLTIRGVGTVAKVEDFTRDNFVTGVDTAVITKINVSVIRSDASGDWEVGKGSTTPLIYSLLEGQSAFTQGSVLFADVDGDITEDNANLSWDNAEDLLAVANLNTNGMVKHKGIYHEVDAITININNGYIIHNTGFNDQIARTAGRVDVYLGEGASSTISEFTAGALPTTNMLITIGNTSTFFANDIVLVTNTKENNGLYEVDFQLGFVIFCRGIGGNPNIESFTRNQVVTSTETGNVRKVTVSVTRTSLTGTIEHGEGSSTPIIYQEFALKSDIIVTAVEEFAASDDRFFGELGLPAGQNGWQEAASGSATVDLQTEVVFGDSKQVVRLNDDVTDGTAQSLLPLTVQNWLDINTFGASYGGTARLDSVNGDSGFFSGLQANIAENPIDTEDRRYGLFFSNTGGFLQLLEPDNNTNIVIMDGTDGNPIILFDEWFKWECVVPAGLGAAVFLINEKITSFVPTFFINSGGTGTKVLIGSGSTGGTNRVSYHDNFGVTIYEEIATKTLSPATMISDLIQIIIPSGKRDYTIILPDGNPRKLADTIDITVSNIGGTITLQTENVGIPESLFNGFNSFTFDVDESETVSLINKVDNANVYIGAVDDFKYTSEERQINYSSLGTTIVVANDDILEADPGDDTKLKIKNSFVIRTVDSTDAFDIKVSDIAVPITTGLSHTIPLGATYWIGVKAIATAPFFQLVFNPSYTDFDSAVEAVIGRADTSATVANQLGTVRNSPYVAKDLTRTTYDYMAVKGNTFLISGGDITPANGSLTYTTEEGRYWRFMTWIGTSNRNYGIEPQLLQTRYDTYNRTGGFESPSTFEQGFYDNNGVKTAVPANKWAITKIYHFAISNVNGHQRGKQFYDSLFDAQSRKGEENSPTHPDFTGAVLTHLIYVRTGATDANNTEHVVFEKVTSNSISSSGDPTVGSLAQSGVIDWVGAELFSINGGDNTKLDFAEFRLGKVARTDGIVRFVKTIPSITDVTVPNMATTPFSYISYNISTDSLVFSGSQVARIDLGNIIPLGRVWHRNNSNLDIAQPMQLSVETSHDYAGLIGSFNAFKSNGLLGSTNGANQKINLSNGTFSIIGGNTLGSREGINTAQPAGGSPLSFTPVRRAVTTSKAILETITSDMDFTVFDDGSGTLATLSPNKFGIHYIGIFPFRSTTDAFLIRGNAEYSTLSAAQEGLQNGIGSPSDFDGIFYVVAIIAKENVTDLPSAIDANDASISQSDRFGSFGGGSGAGAGSVNMQSAYEAGAEPEILTNATRGAITLQQGSGSDTDNVLEIKDGAGVTKMSVQGDGNVGIGVAATEALDVGGNIKTSGVIINNTIYAQLNSSVDQIPASTNPQVITYNTQDAINGLTHSISVNPGEITIDTAGAYFVSPQPQVSKDSGGVKVDFDMFLQVDRGSGFVDEANSNIKLAIKDSDVTDVIVSAFTIILNVGDKIRMMQKTSATGVGMGLKNTDPVTGPPSVPRTPSIIFTMYRIGG